MSNQICIEKKKVFYCDCYVIKILKTIYAITISKSQVLKSIYVNLNILYFFIRTITQGVTTIILLNKID